MANSIIGEISEEIKELGKDTVKAAAEGVKDSGKEFFKAILALGPETKLSPEQMAKKTAEDEKMKQEVLARQRRILKETMAPKPQLQESLAQQKAREEQWRKQRQVELAKQKQMMQLPQMSQKQQRGNLFAVRRHKQNQVELGKSPGQ